MTFLTAYLLSEGRDRIEVAKLDGRYRKTIINERLDEPRAITLYPEKGWATIIYLSFILSRLYRYIYWKYTRDDLIFFFTFSWMFWTDWGNKPKIEKSYMDGTNRKVIVNTGLGTVEVSDLNVMLRSI